MRPHLLTLTAFGSFPGTETVAFDALTEAGLFLVHGPTGAGKTTILDALCFALFGKVANAQRDSARSLRCDHAPPGTGPSVTLEVTVRGRLLRVERSPTWQRPKLRGTGFTEEKAKVIVQERVAGAWQGLTTRADEAGDLIGGLLGMNADQFCQVAMLPQGDFARFLRADGDDRRRLLERLFTVKVFTQAESWLAERRKQTWREQQELRQQVDFAIQRIEEAAGDDLTLLLTALPEPSPGDAAWSEAESVSGPDTESTAGVAGPGDGGLLGLPGLEQDTLFDLPGLDVPSAEVATTATDLDAEASAGGRVGGSGAEARVGVHAAGAGAETVVAARVEPPDPESDPLGWAGALLVAARAAASTSATGHTTAEQALRDARTAYDSATALAERQRRHAEAVTLRRTLDERAEERADLQAVLDEAARADRVLPLVTAARQRAEIAAKTRTLATDAIARARPLLTQPPPGLNDPALPAQLAALERERQDESARLSELLTEEARLSVVRRDLGRVEEELTALAADDEQTTARLSGLPALIEQAEQLLAQSRVDAARIPAAEAVRAAVADVLETDRELVRLAAQLDTLTRRQADLTAAASDLPDRLATAKAALSHARSEAAAIPAATAARDAAIAVLEAARRRDTLTAELAEATITLKRLVDDAQQSRERWLDLRQARLDGMAAELARDLSDGAPCAVCGSPHHPHPASPAESAPSADDEAAAQSAHEAALSRREAAERALATLDSRLTAATESATPTTPHPWATPAPPTTSTEPPTPGPATFGPVTSESATSEPATAASPASGPASSEPATFEHVTPGHVASAETAVGPVAASGHVASGAALGPVADAEIGVGGPASATGSGLSGWRGLGVEEAEQAVREAEQALTELRKAGSREPELAAEVERIEAAQQRAADQAREIGESIAAHSTHHTQLRAERARLLSRLPTPPGSNSGVASGSSAASGSGAPGGHDTTHEPGAIPSPDAAPDPGTSPAGATSSASGMVGASADVPVPDATNPVAGDAPSLGASGAWTASTSARLSVSEGDRGGEVGVEMLRAAEGEVSRLRRSAGREAELAGRVDGLRRERGELEERLRRVTARVAACRTRQEELSGDAGRLAARLDSARGDDATLAARLSRLGDEAELLREALEATVRAAAAVEERASAREAAERAAVEEGFAEVEDAVAAVRPAEAREEKAALLRELDAQYAAVTRTLADPALAGAAREEAPDVAGLEAARDRAEEQYAALVSSRDRARARESRLAELHAELAACLDRWEPAAAAHRLAERLASLASGTSGDNQWSMSLSSFVLGERLRQVVDAANDRLDHMSGGRYQLRHDLRKTAGARGRSGGGLGLRIADGWTGVDRDPATLSGGESFITSLALALGLADVVTAEAGGAEIGTLFVDEGFGTLDEDTLDGVLDILDGLRDGGRAVGIVSHVAELRTRIPAQLRVTKTRTGSTLTVTGV